MQGHRETSLDTNRKAGNNSNKTEPIAHVLLVNPLTTLYLSAVHVRICGELTSHP